MTLKNKSQLLVDFADNEVEAITELTMRNFVDSVLGGYAGLQNTAIAKEVLQGGPGNTVEMANIFETGIAIGANGLTANAATGRLICPSVEVAGHYFFWWAVSLALPTSGAGIVPIATPNPVNIELIKNGSGFPFNGTQIGSLAAKEVAPRSILNWNRFGGTFTGGGTPDDRVVFVTTEPTRISALKLLSRTTTTGSNGTTRYEFMIRNLTDTLDLLAANVTTEAASGGEFSANVVKTILPTQNQVIPAGKVVEVRITKTGSPTAITDLYYGVEGIRERTSTDGVIDTQIVGIGSCDMASGDYVSLRCDAGAAGHIVVYAAQLLGGRKA